MKRFCRLSLEVSFPIDLSRLTGLSGLIACAILSLSWVLAWPAAARADLDGDVKTVLLDRSLSKATTGVEIVRLGDAPQHCVVLFAHKADVPLIPASNLKLVTTSAALDKLGPDFKFRTLLVRHGEDLILIGDGDPTFGDAELLKKSGWDVTTVFKDWADGLRKKGVTSVNNVLVDDSCFEQKFVHPDWPVDQIQKRYVAGVAGMNLNANCIDFYLQPRGAGQIVSYVTDPPTQFAHIRNECISGGKNAVWLTREPNSNNIILKGTARGHNEVPVSVTVDDPPLFAASVLAETLESDGIHVRGSVARDLTARNTLQHLPPGDNQWELAAIHETPLEQVISRANKDSMNLYAECVCKRLGLAISGTIGSWETGVAANAAFLKQAGVADSEYHLDDGCGLSKDNRISPNALVRVLEYDYFSKNRQPFMDSLSVAGEDGTLEKRFEGTTLRGRVFAKSGYVNLVSCLSGYVKARDDNWYAFSIMINGIPSGGKPLQEAIVRAIDNNVSPEARTASELQKASPTTR